MPSSLLFRLVLCLVLFLCWIEGAASLVSQSRLSSCLPCRCSRDSAAHWHFRVSPRSLEARGVHAQWTVLAACLNIILAFRRKRTDKLTCLFSNLGFLLRLSPFAFHIYPLNRAPGNKVYLTFLQLVCQWMHATAHRVQSLGSTLLRVSGNTDTRLYLVCRPSQAHRFRVPPCPINGITTYVKTFCSCQPLKCRF